MLWLSEALLTFSFRYAVLEFETLLDSSSIDSQGWAEIAHTIFRNYKLFDGFVVLHGTDSLAYTCSALSFMLQHLGKPVILTGESKRENPRFRNLRFLFNVRFSWLSGVILAEVFVTVMFWRWCVIYIES